ncbi:hypothetical protein BV98_000015 [Sphingobium herbicidovorans NBRC 16415]|uniref:Uncharacterized protein n=1 Tax=Sphingobium herbicidovorans (strain ATCC 700291 / DSM 11019 / CCUG 56400 / KCTC 2939 / LMG 18315 / NBRC 16415 / MH) TaxID=1219045 RepID=A0A086PEE9_SPHHM|nr:DUF4169 family protein [Sphingobium herbicidovorans]KFG91767.1 hypothetical protein BV98_000015 [Sphingobium herbicidovorans NBRC 16415]
MGDIINLRQARKAKARGEKERVAAANRAKFGRTKAERQASLQEEVRQTQRIEGNRRELPEDDPQ